MLDKSKVISSGEWLLGFKGENVSSRYDLNFLWKYKNIYIMDNHRAALWCWLSEIEIKNKYDFFHLDRHYDTLNSNIESWVKNLPAKLQRLTLANYLELRETKNNVPIISYDNYLSIFLKKYSSTLDKCWFTTYDEGDIPIWGNLQKIHPKTIPSSFEDILVKGSNPWIINLDIDLFFCDSPKDGRMQFHTDSYIKTIGNILKRQNDDGKIAMITIALSPEWTGGWKNAIKACGVLTKAMGVDFNLHKN